MTNDYKYKNDFDLENYTEFQGEEFRNMFISEITSGSYQHICLNAKWGSGKTIFIKQIINYLESDTQETDSFKDVYIYFDAWKYENYSNPVLALLSCINGNSDGFISKNFTEEDYKFDFSLAFKIPIFDITVNGSREQNVTGRFIETLYLDEQAYHIFNKLIEKITNEEPRSIYIFIDELDRCNPEFAMKTIEIFHHFNNNNVRFIYSTDKKQLGSLVNHYYGENYSSEIFFDKVFDKEIILQQIDQSMLNKYAKKRLEGLQGRINDNAYKLISITDLTLRDINTISERLESFSKSATAAILLDHRGINNLGIPSELGFEHLEVLVHVIILNQAGILDMHNMDQSTNAKKFSIAVSPLIEEYNIYRNIRNHYFDNNELNLNMEDFSNLEILEFAVVDLFARTNKKLLGKSKELFYG